MSLWTRIKRALRMKWRAPSECPHPLERWHQAVDYVDVGDIECTDCGAVMFFDGPFGNGRGYSKAGARARRRLKRSAPVAVAFLALACSGPTSPCSGDHPRPAPCYWTATPRPAR